MQVVIYTKENCSYCVSAKMLLVNKGIPFKEMSLGVDFTRETLLEMFPTAKTFPIVVVDGFNIGGFSELVKTLNEQTKQSNLKFLNE
jgi:glutaredoxin 3